MVAGRKLQTGFTEHQPSVRGWEQEKRVLYHGPSLKLMLPVDWHTCKEYCSGHIWEDPSFSEPCLHRGPCLACTCVVCLRCYSHLSGLVSPVQCCCTLPKTSSSCSDANTLLTHQRLLRGHFGPSGEGEPEQSPCALLKGAHAHCIKGHENISVHIVSGIVPTSLYTYTN